MTPEIKDVLFILLLCFLEPFRLDRTVSNEPRCFSRDPARRVVFLLYTAEPLARDAARDGPLFVIGLRATLAKMALINAPDRTTPDRLEDSIG